ncbi:hypothetical protein DOTSEDRAFT_72413, partial [Dothistroma septosporum NZE10]
MYRRPHKRMPTCKDCLRELTTASWYRVLQGRRLCTMCYRRDDEEDEENEDGITDETDVAGLAISTVHSPDESRMTGADRYIQSQVDTHPDRRYDDIGVHCNASQKQRQRKVDLSHSMIQRMAGYVNKRRKYSNDSQDWLQMCSAFPCQTLLDAHTISNTVYKGSELTWVSVLSTSLPGAPQLLLVSVTVFR